MKMRRNKLWRRQQGLKKANRVLRNNSNWPKEQYYLLIDTRGQCQCFMCSGDRREFRGPTRQELIYKIENML